MSVRVGLPTRRRPRVEDTTEIATTRQTERRPGADVLLKMRACHVRYNLVPALRGIDLEVREGEMVALLGPNGAGKTTTLRAISGLIHPHSGQIVFGGGRIEQMSPPEIVRRGVAHVPEGRDLFTGLNVKENLRYGYRPRRKDRAGLQPALEEVFNVFPRLRERSSQKAGTLSGGEQQMLAIGMALMSAPRLLLVDELSLGLAPIVVEQLYEVLREVNSRGTAILLVEQFVPLALANTERAYVLARGEAVMSRSSADLRDDPALLASYLGESVPATEAAPEPAPAKGAASRARGRPKVKR